MPQTQDVEVFKKGLTISILQTNPELRNRVKDIHELSYLIPIKVRGEKNVKFLLATKIIISYLDNLDNGLDGYSELFFMRGEIKQNAFEALQKRIIETILVLKKIIENQRIIFEKDSKLVRNILWDFIKNGLIYLAQASFKERGNPNYKPFWELCKTISMLFKIRRQEIISIPDEIDLDVLGVKKYIKHFSPSDL